MGGNPATGRTELDFYATNPKAVETLLANHTFTGDKILEPCVGAGHIAKILKNKYKDADFTFLDIVDRGFPDTQVCDFLNWDGEEGVYDTIITNPPYSLANEFIYKCMYHLRLHGQLAMFLKIQFLEGQKRRKLFKEYPPRYVYVFRKRICVFSNGIEKDPKTGKDWATTLCNAWYVWQKGYVDEPVIRWLD